MHEFFAGCSLVSYGLKGIFAPVWANDISEHKAAVYEANFCGNRFELGDIESVKGSRLPTAHLSWVSFPCQDLLLACSLGVSVHSVWEWLRILDKADTKPKVLFLENVVGLPFTNRGNNYRLLHSLSKLRLRQKLSMPI